MAPPIALFKEMDGHVSVVELVPATLSQSYLWLVEYGQPGGLMLGASACLSADVDFQALIRAATELATRHEAFRTVIGVTSGCVTQSVYPPGVFAAQVTKCSHPLSEALMLSDQPAWAVRVAGRREIFMVAHHAICDGLSLRMALDELLDLYSHSIAASPSRREGATFSSPRLARDYARWEVRPETRLLLQQNACALADDLSGVGLTLDFPRALPGGRLTCHFNIDPATSSRFDRALANAGCTRHIGYLTAVQFASWRCFSAGDLATAMPWHNRTPQFARTIGQFSQLLPVRSSRPTKGTLRDAVIATRTAVLRALKHTPYDPFKFQECMHAESTERRGMPRWLNNLFVSVDETTSGYAASLDPSTSVGPVRWEDSLPTSLLDCRIRRTEAGTSGWLVGDPSVLGPDELREIANSLIEFAGSDLSRNVESMLSGGSLPLREAKGCSAGRLAKGFEDLAFVKEASIDSVNGKSRVHLVTQDAYFHPAYWRYLLAWAYGRAGVGMPEIMHFVESLPKSCPCDNAELLNDERIARIGDSTTSLDPDLARTPLEQSLMSLLKAAVPSCADNVNAPLVELGVPFEALPGILRSLEESTGRTPFLATALLGTPATLRELCSMVSAEG